MTEPRKIKMTEPRKIKRSIVITLVLISSISLIACASRRYRREVYRSLEDCYKEWGIVVECEPVTDGSYSSEYYYGPYYYQSGYSGRYFYRNSNSSYQPVPSNAGILQSPSGKSTTSVGTVNRGGFGSRGSGSSFGGRGGGKG